MPIERFGKYQLERSLAQGGMAEIFLARQSGPVGFQKVVVIKRVLQRLAGDKTFQEMFLDEARIAARLDHPGIVQIFDFGETEGSYFIAMEYLAGEDFAALLKAELARRNTVPPAIAARLLSAVCDALHYAHTFVDEHDKPLNIIHRDLSPSNLFLTYAGAVKVLDFGLAKAEGKKVQTMDGQIKGKFQYMSPEQIFGQKLDARSDIFALGAVLHELVAGQPTFLRDEPVGIFRAITEEPIIPLTDLVPGIGDELAGIAARALERDPAKRFRSALEMRKALDAYLAASATVSPTAQLQDYIRGLVPAEQIQKKTRPLAGAAPAAQGEDDPELDHAPTHRRLEAVDENGAPLKASSTQPRLDALSPDKTPLEPLPPVEPNGGVEVLNDGGATVLEAPAFRRPQVVVPAPKAKLRTSKMMQVQKEAPPDDQDGTPTDRGIDVAGLEVEPEVSATPTRPSQPSLPAAIKSQAGPRSWPTVDANETAREGTLSPLASSKRTAIIDAVEDGPRDEPDDELDDESDLRPGTGLLARLGLTTPRDLVLAGVGLGLLVLALAILVAVL